MPDIAAYSRDSSRLDMAVMFQDYVRDGRDTGAIARDMHSVYNRGS